MPSVEYNADPVAVAESARRARIACARTDIDTFLELVLKDETTGRSVEQAECHTEWHEACDRHDRVILYSHIESGKAVPLDTPISTPAGWATMGELRVGSTVFGADGLPYKVIGCSPIQYERDVYEVVFDDGVVEKADADHNWLAWSLDDLAVHGSGKPRVVTTKEMRARLYRAGPGGRQQAKWHVPVAAPVQYPEAVLPIHPYVLGSWLGDGEAKTAMLTVHENDRVIAERCIALEGGRCGKWHRDTRNPKVLKINIGGDDDKHTNYDPTRLRARLRRLGVLGNKHIPEMYLTASEAQRRELLAGLIDTDGSVSGDGKGRVEFTSTVQALSEGVAELIRSLGFTVTCKRSAAKLYGRVTGYRWRVAWTPHEPVCTLPRKLARQRVDNDRRWTRHRAITAIRKIASCPVKCITVESPDHTYLLGRSYTVTHNTQQISIGRTLFELGRNPNLRIALVSATERLGQKNLGFIANYIESSDALHSVFPKLIPGEPWTATSITVKGDITKRDPSVQILGVHGGILGSRLDLIILDDILTYENTLTPHRRQDTWDWYHSTLAGRLTANGRVIAIGTAWHPEDLLHRLAAQPRWYCMRYPVEDKAGEPMWPEQWPKDRIDLKRTELGPLEFARQMLCQARDDAEARFQRPWIDQCLEAGEKCQPATSALDFFRKHPKLAPPAWFSEDHPQLEDAMDVLNRMEIGVAGQFLTGVDLAVQRHSAADETVLFTIYLHPNGKRQVVDVTAGKWTGPEIVRNIIGVQGRFNSVVLVENNAAQSYILQFAVEIGGVIPIFPFTTGKNKTNPVYGVESLATEMANAHWIIPSKGGVAACVQMQKWIQEMLFYDPQAHTGDRLMACVTPGQPVTTARGLVPIEEVCVGDKVLTHKSRWREVTCVTNRDYRGEILDVKPRGLPKISVTPEHPFLACPAWFERASRTNRLIPRENAWDWVDAQNLRVGRKAAGDFILAPFADWSNESCSALTKEQLFVTGLYLAEGWVNDHQVSFGFNAETEQYLFEFVRKVFREWWGCNTAAYTRVGTKSLHVCAHSVAAARYFSQFGKRSNKKSLPWSMMNFPVIEGLMIARGWLAGDGHMVRDLKTGYWRVKGTSVSPELVYQMQQIMWKAGLLPSVCAHNNSGTFMGKRIISLPAQQLSLSETDTATLLQYKLPVEVQRWADKPSRCRDRTNSSGCLLPGSVAIKIASITSHQYSGKIYNLHVDEDESFTVGGIAVHNSWFARELARRVNVKVTRMGTKVVG